MALNESAKKLKHSSPTPTETDSDKFTFRTWLIRLGFIGADYKKAREVLLKNLQANGAYRKKITDRALEALLLHYQQKLNKIRIILWKSKKTSDIDSEYRRFD